MQSISEITPCETCPRNYNPADYDEAGEAALAHLIDNACDASGCVSSLDEEQRQRASQFYYGDFSESEDPYAVGAVGRCGRAIGREACSRWRLSKDATSIIEKGE